MATEWLAYRIYPEPSGFTYQEADLMDIAVIL